MVVFLQGKPDRENSSSARTKCPAMLSLLRTEDGGWYGIYVRTGCCITMNSSELVVHVGFLILKSEVPSRPEQAPPRPDWHFT